MVTLKPGDLVAQRPDAVVTYRLRPEDGWPANPIVTVERFRPATRTTLPDVTSTPFGITVRTQVAPSAGTPVPGIVCAWGIRR